MPIAFKIKHGSLFVDVVKAYVLSQKGELLGLTADLSMNLDGEPVLGRQWFTMKELNAANYIKLWWKREKVQHVIAHLL